ncbi:Por secretion system C-terminal sorting domain-containing protein [Chryseobacterium soldanellicola]|uniref:Por secretion system C-terminal sorting domain-containing protein n=2 Tax=Chryseobacterium soldanellicola TaxID=311333 RepID=A0A1H1B2V6_9FLAO|nr:Por secretion system C-terminal sorting domain-containing protein [Chryseobacterium soldanellicola]
MKNLRKFSKWAFLFMLFFAGNTYAQIENKSPFLVGTTRQFLSHIQKNQSLGKQEQRIKLSTSASNVLDVKINYFKNESNGITHLEGEVLGTEQGSFTIRVSESKFEGNIILPKSKKAYSYYSDAKGNAYIRETDINKLICTDYKVPVPKEKPVPSATKTTSKTTDVSNLQSYPGAAGCILLDFDGHYMPAGSWWNGGNAINAAPAGMTNDEILQAWEVVAEDFRPFGLNVTTNEAVFNTYPANKRMRNVITTTNTADQSGSASGIAYMNSFSNANDNDTPCWTFTNDYVARYPKFIGDVTSHEVGHTFGLSHDGTLDDPGGYYPGHGYWGPIMGISNNNVVQWSKGEYSTADNHQDDLAIISGSANGVGYRADDHGNNISGATTLSSMSGQISATANQNSGIIGTTGDIDMFTFTTTGGDVAININAIPRNSNLRLGVTLFNGQNVSQGTYYANAANLGETVVINKTLAAGKYYISVTGVNDGTADTGYTNYDSLGAYTISGYFPSNYACVGGTVQLMTNITGISYQWQYQYGGVWNSYPEGNNGYATFSGSQTATMTVSNISSSYISGANTARVAVTLANGTVVYSVPQVWGASGIISQPAPSTTACVGGSLTLSAQASGSSYQWQYLSGGNWINYPEGNNGVATFTGSQTPSMTISNITSGYIANNNQARLVVYGLNGCSTASNVITWGASGIISQPAASITACVGGSLTLSAQASGSSYQWQYLSGGIWNNYPEGNNGAATFTGSKTPSMTISNITSGYVTNPNQARLVVYGSNGCSTASNVITWGASGIISQPAASTTACVGGSLTLSAQASGSSYQWQYLSGGNWINYPEGNNGIATFTGSKTPSMTVSNITSGYVTNPNQARLVVYASNGCTTVSNTATWKAVNCAGRQSVNDEVKPTSANDQAVYPNPVKDELNISLGSEKGNYKVEISNSLGQVLYTTTTSERLIQVSFYGKPSGLYIVTIKNSANENIKSFKVIKQ